MQIPECKAGQKVSQLEDRPEGYAGRRARTKDAHTPPERDHSPKPRNDSINIDEAPSDERRIGPAGPAS
jgi:hypothetical protein